MWSARSRVGTETAVGSRWRRLPCNRVSLFHVWQHKVYLVPAAQFTMEFIEPKVHCISVHGTFSSNR